MCETSTLHETLFRDDRYPREEPLAGPRRSFDPWIVSCGWVDGWVLDMCDSRDPSASARDVPEPRPIRARLASCVARAALAVMRHGGRPRSA